MNHGCSNAIRAPWVRMKEFENELMRPGRGLGRALMKQMSEVVGE